MQMFYFMTYSHNRFEFLTIRSGDYEPTLFLIDNIFIYHALSASQLCCVKVCVHILLHDTLHER